MDTEIITSEDAILGGDYDGTDLDEAAILGETQETAPTPEPEPIAAPEPPQPQPQQAPAIDDRQANAFAVMQQKLNQAHYELEQLRQAQQTPPDTGFLGDEELGFINGQLSQRDQYWQGQISQIQSQTSLQFAAMQANQGNPNGWQETLDLARAEAERDAAVYGIDPQQIFANIDGSPTAGQQIMALANKARDRQAQAQPVDTKALEAAAYQRALRDFQAKSAASPHNLAPPSIGNLPAAHVSNRVLSDDEILGQ